MSCLHFVIDSVASVDPRYLEDVEGLELDVGALVPQQVHHQLEVLGLADVARHHREVVPVQEQLAKKLQEHTQIH